MKAYAEEKGVYNTAFHDTFPVEETSKYLENIDVMNNLYGNETVGLRKAISIKLFHALYAKIPILVCPDTYVGSVALQLGIGFEIGDEMFDETLPDKVYEWYHSIDFAKMKEASEAYLEITEGENEIFREKLLSIL